MGLLAQMLDTLLITMVKQDVIGALWWVGVLTERGSLQMVNVH